MEDRIIYYPKTDLAVFWELEKVCKAIERYKKEDPNNIIDIIELYNIRKLIEHDIKLEEWSDDKFEQIKKDTEKYNAKVAKFFKNINKDNVYGYYLSLDFSYEHSFWDIIEQFKLYVSVGDHLIKNLIDKKIDYLHIILRHKGLVDKYKVTIRNILLDKPHSAHFIIDKYIPKYTLTREIEIHLPENLTTDDKENIINKYLDCENPNLNYVELICQNKDDKNGLLLSPKTKLKAKKLREKLTEEIFKKENTISLEYGLIFTLSNEDNIEPFSIKRENNITRYIYCSKYIRGCTNIELVKNFIVLFVWMNKHFLVDLISKTNEVGGLEYVTSNHSKNSYTGFWAFKYKEQISIGQTKLYYKQLNNMDTSFEQVLKNFYESYIKEKYNYEAHTLSMPLSEDTWLNKCRVIIPEIEAIIRQYNTFIENDKVDFELTGLIKPFSITEAKSLLENKYYEVNYDSTSLSKILRNMFNTSSPLYKDDTFGDLLYNKKKTPYGGYKDYQKKEIDLLISEEIIVKDSNEEISLASEEYYWILRSLWEYRACSYWRYNEEGRALLDQMSEKGWLIKSDKLLTKEEQKYFSYYLDNKEFTNGPAYRNHYSHGTTPPAEKEFEHEVAYYTFLRLLSIVILKISDDLWSACCAIYNYQTNKSK